jgi:hypothetical protein
LHQIGGVLIDVVNDKDKGFASMEHLLAASPYPIFKVRKDATVVYANEAASHAKDRGN